MNVHNAMRVGQAVIGHDIVKFLSPRFLCFTQYHADTPTVAKLLKIQPINIEIRKHAAVALSPASARTSTMQLRLKIFLLSIVRRCGGLVILTVQSQTLSLANGRLMR
jgi:hypothetical protein